MEDGLSTYIPLGQSLLTAIGLIVAALIAKQGVESYREQKTIDSENYREQRETDRRSELNQRKAEEYISYQEAYWEANRLAKVRNQLKELLDASPNDQQVKAAYINALNNHQKAETEYQRILYRLLIIASDGVFKAALAFHKYIVEYPTPESSDIGEIKDLYAAMITEMGKDAFEAKTLSKEEIIPLLPFNLSPAPDSSTATGGRAKGRT